MWLRIYDLSLECQNFFLKESASEADSLKNKVLALQRLVMKASVQEQAEIIYLLYGQPSFYDLSLQCHNFIF